MRSLARVLHYRCSCCSCSLYAFRRKSSHSSSIEKGLTNAREKTVGREIVKRVLAWNRHRHCRLRSNVLMLLSQVLSGFSAETTASIHRRRSYTARWLPVPSTQVSGIRAIYSNLSLNSRKGSFAQGFASFSNSSSFSSCANATADGRSDGRFDSTRLRVCVLGMRAAKAIRRTTVTHSGKQSVSQSVNPPPRSA